MREYCRSAIHCLVLQRPNDLVVTKNLSNAQKNLSYQTCLITRFQSTPKSTTFLKLRAAPPQHNIMRMVPIRLPIVLLSEILGLQSWFSSLPQVTTSKAGREKRKQNTVEVFESKCLGVLVLRSVNRSLKTPQVQCQVSPSTNQRPEWQNLSNKKMCGAPGPPTPTTDTGIPDRSQPRLGS